MTVQFVHKNMIQIKHWSKSNMIQFGQDLIKLFLDMLMKKNEKSNIYVDRVSIFSKHIGF